MKPSIRHLLYILLIALSTQLTACGGSDDSSTSSDNSSSSDDSGSSSDDGSSTEATSLTGSLSTSSLSASETTTITATLNADATAQTIITATESNGLLTFSGGSTCTIASGEDNCTIRNVTANSVEEDSSGTIALNTTLSSGTSLSTSVSFSVNADSSSGSDTSDTTEGFVMGYYANYKGYQNNNQSTSGKAIAEPGYNIPGITDRNDTSNEANGGFPAYNEDGIVAALSTASETNAHLTDMVEGLSALTYGFILPESNGVIVFNDGWADLANDDWSSGGLCDTSNTDDTVGYQVCYKDSASSTEASTGTATDRGDQSQYGYCNYVCYGSFDAFLAVNNSAGDLKHYISVGGYTYMDFMDRLVSSDSDVATTTAITSKSFSNNDENIKNFLQVLSHLKDQGLEGVDLDIEFGSPSSEYTNSLLLRALADTKDVNGHSNSYGKNLVGQIHDLGLEVSITIQANPDMLLGLMGNDDADSGFNYIQSWFDNGLDHLNLMSYDFHGTWDYGSYGYTGFNNNLFTYDNSDYQTETGSDDNTTAYVNPFDEYTDVATDSTSTEADFSTDGAIRYLNAGNGTVDSWNKLGSKDLQKVNIGIAAYGRAYNGIASDKGNDNATDPYGTGLYQSIDNATIVAGDNDYAYCDTSLANASTAGTPCGGILSYNYIVNDIATDSSFTSKDWKVHDDYKDKDYYIGSTLYNSGTWNVPDPTVVFDQTSNGTDISSVGVSSTVNSGSETFITYTSAADAESLGEYVKDRGLGGVIMWTVDGDSDYTDTSNSLIYNFHQGYNYLNNE
ncbi:glycoside hydrolase family 18 protein [uncultured Shewanella sp.]|uniref:glycoside hydrolase family 18 protein n=1 Tax=uncultured Shewanella sp. TaxID=173975 RepID=UPI0026266865|nr:glycoside hydrolase family 18 protein [uncultured Shewanella sp.]